MPQIALSTKAPRNTATGIQRVIRVFAKARRKEWEKAAAVTGL